MIDKNFLLTFRQEMSILLAELILFHQFIYTERGKCKMEKKKPAFIQSILDIPMALKGFPKNLLKEPKNATELAQCQREHKAYLWLAAVPLIAAVIMMALQLDEGISMILGLVGFLALILLLYRMNQIKNFVGAQIGDLTCPECNEMITFDENVRYEVKNVSWGVHSTKLPVKRGEEHSPMNVSATGRETADVTIVCKCQKCGNQHSFDKSFVTGECRKEQRDVVCVQADRIKAQLENEVRQVSRTVFVENEDGENDYGVSVKRYSVEASVEDYFTV